MRYPYDAGIVTEILRFTPTVLLPSVAPIYASCDHSSWPPLNRVVGPFLMRRSGAMQILVDLITPEVEQRLRFSQAHEYASENEVCSLWPNLSEVED